MSPSLARDDAETPRAEARSPGLVILFIAILLVASRVFFVTSALHGSELTTDEPDLTLMALDRYFGAPMANTHWPAVTNQMVMTPAIGADFLLSGQARTAGGFAAYAGRIYRDPARLVCLHRMMIVLLTTLATLILAWTLRRRGLVVVIAATLLLQNDHLITYGTLGLGNGTALAAMIGCVAAMLHGGCARRRSFLAGVLFGLALASRNTSILFAPLLLGFAWQGDRRMRARVTLVAMLIVGTLAGSAPAWSLALLEPIRWLKANVGNFVKIGPPVGLRAALGVLLSTTGVCAWLVTLVAIGWLLVRRRSVAIVVGWLAAFALAVVISARSPLVETRYFDAIVLGAVMLCVLAIVDVMSVDARAGRTAGGVIAVASICAVVGCWTAYSRFDMSRIGLRAEERAVARSIQATDGKQIVDRILIPFLKPRMSSASLRGLAEQTEASLHNGGALSEFVTRYKLDPEVAAVFAGDLTEKEHGDIVRNRVAAIAPAAGEPLEINACGDSNSAQRYGVIPTADVPDIIRDGKANSATLRADSLPALDVAGLSVEPVGSGKYVRIRRLGA